jgi:hypothetical protein
MQTNRRHGMWCALLACAFAFGTVAVPPRALAAAAKPAKRAKDKADAKAKSPVQGYYAIVVKQVGLEGDQLAKYTEAVAARTAAIDAWKKDNAAKLEAYNAAVKQAKEKNDKDALKKANADAKELNTSLRKVEDEQRAKIMAVLTPEQHVKLNGYNLYVGAMVRYKKTGLSEEQTAKVRALCDKAAQDAGSDYGSDKKKDAAVRKQLAESIEKDVLTAEQRAALAAPKKKDDAKPKKPADK